MQQCIRISSQCLYFLAHDFSINCIREVLVLFRPLQVPLVPYLWFVSAAAASAGLFSCIENPEAHVPPDLEISQYRRSISAVPKIQYPGRACSVQPEIEPATLAVFITKLLCARSSAKSLVGPFLLKETNKWRHSWKCYVRVFSVFLWMLPDNHRWVTLNGIFWGSDGFHTV